MPAYKQTSTWYEDGFGDTVDVVIVTDDFTMLDDLAGATEVGIFVIEGTKEDLDLKSGVFAADEITFNMNEAAIDTADDAAAISFVLEAQDPTARRYFARLINPSDPPDPSDFVMRGVVNAAMSATDLLWSDDEYGSAPNPLRDWKCSAASFEAQEMLGVDLGVVIDGSLLPDEPPEDARPRPDGSLSPGIDEEWIEDNVADRLGYFKDDETLSPFPPNAPIGLREARWGNLVNLGALLNKLLSIAAAPGFTVTFVTGGLNMLAAPARFVPFVTTDGRPLRYTNRFSMPGYIAPYRRMVDDYYEANTGEEGGSLWVSYRLVNPVGEEEDGLSWRRYGTAAELLYSLALSLNSYVEITYASATEIEVRFQPRSQIVGDRVYLRDAVSADLDLTPIETSEEENRAYTAASWQVSAEGPEVQYNYDGLGFKASRPADAAPTSGELLPVSISPTWCLLENRGRDAFYNLGDVYGFSIIPHNIVFWQDGARIPGVQPAETSRAVLHTGLYMLTTGRADDGSVGVEDLDVWAPVAGVSLVIDGKRRFFTHLADLANVTTQRDQAYFEAEYTITVPGLNSFRADPDVPGSWKLCKRGARVVYDEIEYVIVGIERKRFETQLRLHVTSRFAIDISTEIDGAEIDGVPPPAATSQLPRTNAVSTYHTGAAVDSYVLVTQGANGLIYPSEALHTHYDNVIGITLAAAAADADVEVQLSGRIRLDPDRYTFSAGTRVYLRTPVDPDTQNISDELLTASGGGEDMFCAVGKMEPDNILVLNIQPARIFYPEIIDA